MASAGMSFQQVQSMWRNQRQTDPQLANLDRLGEVVENLQAMREAMALQQARDREHQDRMVKLLKKVSDSSESIDESSKKSAIAEDKLVRQGGRTFSDAERMRRSQQAVAQARDPSLSGRFYAKTLSDIDKIKERVLQRVLRPYTTTRGRADALQKRLEKATWQFADNATAMIEMGLNRTIRYIRYGRAGGTRRLGWLARNPGPTASAMVVRKPAGMMTAADRSATGINPPESGGGFWSSMLGAAGGTAAGAALMRKLRPVGAFMGKVGRGIGVGARASGVAGLVLSGISAVTGAIEGYFNAPEILNRRDPAVMGRISAVIGGAVNGLTFGIADNIAQWMGEANASTLLDKGHQSFFELYGWLKRTITDNIYEMYKKAAESLGLKVPSQDSPLPQDRVDKAAKDARDAAKDNKEAAENLKQALQGLTPRGAAAAASAAEELKGIYGSKEYQDRSNGGVSSGGLTPGRVGSAIGSVMGGFAGSPAQAAPVPPGVSGAAPGQPGSGGVGQPGTGSVGGGYPALPQGVPNFPIGGSQAGKTWADVPSSGGSPNSREWGGPRGGGRHAGIDIPGNVGDPVFSVTGGKVIGMGVGQGYGKYVDIEAPDGTIHRKAHLSGFGDIKKGDVLQPGTTVGQVGYTGNAGPEFPHLHLEVFKNRKAYDAAATTGSRQGWNLRMNPRDYYNGITQPEGVAGALKRGNQAAIPPSAGFAAAAAAANPDLLKQVSPQDFFAGKGVNANDMPLGLRHSNNPGNIKFTGSEWQRNNFPGLMGPSVARDQGDPQAQFSNIEAGTVAAARLALLKNQQQGMDTVEKIIRGPNGWTPGHPMAAGAIAKSMGLKPTDKINLSDPETMQKFLRALFTQEHGGYAAKHIDDATIQRGVNTALGIQGVPSVADRGMTAGLKPSSYYADPQAGMPEYTSPSVGGVEGGQKTYTQPEVSPIDSQDDGSWRTNKPITADIGSELKTALAEQSQAGSSLNDLQRDSTQIDIASINTQDEMSMMAINGSELV